MADWLWTQQALSAGFAMTRDGFDGYLREHRVPSPPPPTLPSAHGEVVELYELTVADLAATDWRLP